jgi:3-isopropylmalate/(R)-2-methylmalate dehydratase large subunit
MKMPTKAELLKLQKQYHTDKRIAEALGGNVTEHLVQYWRRKKGIPRRSFPKYSEAQIRELWERFGDDFRCGRELGLSKAGFYSWRRRYGIKEKPRTLKLEQLELRFGSEPKLGRNGVFIEYYRTAAEKILARCSDDATIEYNKSIEVTPDLIVLDVSHGEQLDSIRVPGKVAHRVRLITGLKRASSGGRVNGLISVESVFSLLQSEELIPSILIAQNDCIAGGLSALSALIVSVGESQTTQLLKTGKFSLSVPATVRITLRDRLQRGVTAFDILSYVVSNLPAAVLRDRVVEYAGSVIEKLDVYERICLCDLTQASGAICGYTAFDEAARKFLAKRGRADFKVWFSDSKAYYHHDYVLTISGLEPQAVLAGDMTSTQRIRDLPEIGPVDIVFIGGACAGGIEAIKQVSELLRKRKISGSTRLFVSPLTNHTYIEALRRRVLIPIVEAGGVILPPGYSLEDIPGFDPETDATVVTTPCRCDSGYPANCWLVNHLSAAASALKGSLTYHKK